MSTLQTLPNKYRPLLFKDLVGQEHNQKFFKALIANGQISRNIVLAGFFGSSKTTSARIYARALLCDHPTEDGEPCNQCENCKKSLAGNHPDIMEVDASSKGGKDDIISLVDVAKTPPLFSKRRIIICDEVQAFSRQAWDALLKLIEEPPSFLTFIFCTTEKDKVRPAILSRCAVRDVNLLTQTQAVEHLKNICTKEGFKYEDSALTIIANASQGHPRDLLKNLEQVSFIGDISESNTRLTLTDSSIDETFDFLVKLHTADHPTVLSLILRTSLAPATLFNTSREILTHYLYNIFQQYSLDFNILIPLVSQELSTALYQAITSTAKTKNIPAIDYLTSLLNLFKTKPTLKIDLVSQFTTIYNFIHSSATDSSSKAQMSASSKTQSGIRRHREFANNYSQPAPIPAPTPQPIPVPEAEPPKPVNKVYGHTLLQDGFKTVSLDNITLTEI